MFDELEIAVLVPCYNEEAAVGAVVRDFRAALPGATVYVYDNNSTDRTTDIARSEGAVVRNERLQGKGNVVRRMFADIDADVYVMVDGDGTYDASSAPKLVQVLLDQAADMVNAVREAGEDDEAYRFGHVFGNRMLTGMVARIFGDQVEDMLSGYRAFSRRFVKSFPALSSGFEIETELTVHGLELGLPVAEVHAPYRDRPAGSSSKLNTVRDGLRILVAIVRLFMRERPLRVYGAVCVGLAAVSIGLAIPLFVTYAETGLVPRFPSAILSSAIMLLAFLSLTAGLILDTVTHGRRESRRLAYLQIPGLDSRRLESERPPAESPPGLPGQT